MITDKGNVFCPIGSFENASLNRVPWGRWWGGRILGLWWSRGRLFFKEAFIWPLLLDGREPLGKMKGLPSNGYVIEQNGFV